ncbi:MAG: PHP domain-containing protein [Spirochaetia bacterium]|nr:PHP domain-containing protein [uncultured Treponema sp.]MCI7397135.1 PHP domain-containing protein [Spirochaetia bacterium]MCI7578273.1 PHP domain-containing protein [Spirochaetia bacterium]
MIDLHTHSTASDGTYTPAQLMEYAHARNINAIALTDHDSIDGIIEAQKKARELSMEFIPGIELSIQWPTGEFHLLGLGLQSPSKELLGAIDFLRQERDNRNIKMAQKLQEQGIAITYEEVVEKAGTKTIGRPHFASLMIEKGFIRQRQQAFDQYFAKGRPCYVERTGLDLEDAVKAIKTSGGIPVQAHPLSMYVSWGKMEDTMIDIQMHGVEGLEAWHPGTRVSEAYRLEELARKLGMTATAGSDFHGEKVRADRKIGYTAGKSKIEDKFWYEELKPALEKIHKGADLEFRL